MTDTINTINPFTEETVATYSLLSLNQAELAVEEAHHRFESWRRTSLDERAILMHSLADVLESHSDELARLMTTEMGKLVQQGLQEVELCAAICRYTADTAVKELADEQRQIDGGTAIITKQPIGVILGIQPWNFPLYQVIRYSVVNVMAGNTTVLKHASNVAGMSKKIEALFASAGFPKSVFTSLLIDGETATNLIAHPKVRGVTFTGSDEIGKKVAAEAAKHAKKTVLELGSNDAYIVLDDADIALAVESCVKGRIINNGETCVSAKRFIITEKNYDDFKLQFIQAMQNLTSGDPTDDDTDLGPMAREDLRDELHEQVKQSINHGATASLGCEIPEKTGFFYPVSVLENVSPGMPAYDDELFGPVASLIRVADDKEAIQVANDSRYGLGGGLFCKDVEYAKNIAIRDFDTGMVTINGYALAQPNLPFGGVKQSGYGREHGGFGITEFVNIKTVTVMN